MGNWEHDERNYFEGSCGWACYWPPSLLDVNPPIWCFSDIIIICTDDDAWSLFPITRRTGWTRTGWSNRCNSPQPSPNATTQQQRDPLSCSSYPPSYASMASGRRGWCQRTRPHLVIGSSSICDPTFCSTIAKWSKCEC